MAQLPNKIIGLYLSAQDFTQQKISYQINTNAVKKIKPNNEFRNKHFIIKNNSKKTKVATKTIYGFICSDSSRYAIIENNYYKILFSSPNITLYKNVTQMPFNGRTNVTPYYFSKNIGSTLHSLTKNKLLQKYSLTEIQKQAFIKKFQFNTDLIEIDKCSSKPIVYNYLN
jgi:hypothetical protein